MKWSYEYFKNQTNRQVKLNGFISPATGLEMLGYMAELERKLAEVELPR